MNDRRRPEGQKRPDDVANAKQRLTTALDMIEAEAGSKPWAMGDAYTMVDCAASPAFFYGHQGVCCVLQSQRRCLKPRRRPASCSEPISDHYSAPPNQGARNLELAHNNVVCAVFDTASTSPLGAQIMGLFDCALRYC